MLLLQTFIISLEISSCFRFSSCCCQLSANWRLLGLASRPCLAWRSSMSLGSTLKRWAKRRWWSTSWLFWNVRATGADLATSTCLFATSWWLACARATSGRPVWWKWEHSMLLSLDAIKGNVCVQCTCFSIFICKNLLPLRLFSFMPRTALATVAGSIATRRACSYATSKPPFRTPSVIFTACFRPSPPPKRLNWAFSPAALGRICNAVLVRWAGSLSRTGASAMLARRLCDSATKVGINAVLSVYRLGVASVEFNGLQLLM